MKVSIICLTYNHEKYIEEALNGMLSQNVNFDYEILVSDDASTDKTAEIVRRYAEKYPDIIKFFSNKKNTGATKNAYNMLQMAQGDYIATCEGDDRWTSTDKLQKQVDFLDNNPLYVGCVNNVRLIDESGEPLKRQKLVWLSNKKVFTVSDFDGRHIPGHVSTLLRRNIIKTQGANVDVVQQASANVGDRTVYLVWLQYGPFYKINDTTTDYRVRRKGENLTSNLYSQNKSRTRLEYNYLCNLDDYAKSIPMDVNIEKSFRDLYVNAVIDLIRYGKNRDNSLPKEIKAKVKRKGLLYICFIFIFIKKLILKYTTVS